MRKTIFILSAFIALGIGSTAQAEDGFGTPFMNETHAGFSDDSYQQYLAQGASADSVANIEPAAGDVTKTVIIENEGDLIKLEQAIKDMTETQISE